MASNVDGLVVFNTAGDAAIDRQTLPKLNSSVDVNGLSAALSALELAGSVRLGIYSFSSLTLKDEPPCTST